MRPLMRGKRNDCATACATAEMSRDASTAGPIGNRGCSPRSNPGHGMALPRTHTSYPKEARDTGRSAWTQEDGSDERGKHRHEWEDHRPMAGSLDEDNDGSSYARVKRIGRRNRGREWEKIVTDIAPIVIAESLRSGHIRNEQPMCDNHW